MYVTAWLVTGTPITASALRVPLVAALVNARDRKAAARACSFLTRSNGPVMLSFFENESEMRLSSMTTGDEITVVANVSQMGRTRRERIFEEGN